MYPIRICESSIEQGMRYEWFSERHIDTRPMFYTINTHKHLNDSSYTDISTPEIISREIMMLPSSPTLTYKEQQYIVLGIYEFIFHLKGIRLINATGKIDEMTTTYID